MKKRCLVLILFIAIIVVLSACSEEEKSGADEQTEPKNSFLLVKGGTFTSTKSNYYGKSVSIADFYIGKYEVTQKEWVEVMGGNPSAFKGEHLPVEMISWYDAVEYCNQRSIKEGLTPYYHIDKNTIDANNKSEYDNIKWTVTINEDADGYRLPTEAEWEYAAGGGQKSKSYTFSGSNDVDEVSWNWRNAGNKYLKGDWLWSSIENNRNSTKTVGTKKPNELGLYDMSGNVREWCWNWYDDKGSDSSSGSNRVVRGGGWVGDIVSNELTYRGKFEASGFGPDQGFRVVRSK